MYLKFIPLLKDFSEVRSQIEQNYKLEKSQDKVYELYNIIEDQRAEGLTLEEIAETNNIKYPVIPR